jgi:hypothetical protein
MPRIGFSVHPGFVARRAPPVASPGRLDFGGFVQTETAQSPIARAASLARVFAGLTVLVALTIWLGLTLGFQFSR